MKYIRKLIIKAKGMFQLQIRSEITETLIDIDGDTIISNLSIAGVLFDLKIISYSNFNIKSLILTFDEAGE